MSAAPTGPPAVLVNDVHKRFSLPEDRVQTLKERALHPIRSSRRNEFEALKGVSFHVERGEFFGLVGRNGSGKSTLLKCIAGIYPSDDGTIHHTGSLSSFIELGVGFNPELAAFDNVVLNATLLGLTPAQARERYDQIIDFAELREFENLKLKNYSSGMHVRLAFSAMIQVDAEILLIDEVLAVGDAAFQQKCYNEFNRLREAGTTIVFVSHDMDAVKRFCDRALLLERGDMVAIGDPTAVSDEYLALNFERAAQASNGVPLPAAEYAKFVDLWFEDADGERRSSIRQGERFSAHVSVEFLKEVVDPWIALSLENEFRNVLLNGGSDDTSGARYAPGDRAHFSVTSECIFAPGKIDLSVTAGTLGNRQPFLRADRVGSVVVTGENAHGAVVVLPREVALEREAQ